MKFKRAENEQPRISFLLFSNAQCSLPVQGEGPRPCISPHLPSRIPLKYQNIKINTNKITIINTFSTDSNFTVSDGVSPTGLSPYSLLSKVIQGNSSRQSLAFTYAACV